MCASVDILAAAPAMRLAGGAEEGQDLAIGGTELLHDHSVGALRHDSAGQDLDGLSALDRAEEGMACGGLSDQPKPHSRAGDHIGVPDGEAVHRRQVREWQVYG